MLARYVNPARFVSSKLIVDLNAADLGDLDSIASCWFKSLKLWGNYDRILQLGAWDQDNMSQWNFHTSL